MVDDNEDARESLADVLRLSGLSVVTASDSEQALERAAEETTDAYVVDVGLPRMDGYEVARRLRQMATARPPSWSRSPATGRRTTASAPSTPASTITRRSRPTSEELRRLLTARSQVAIDG